MVNYKNTLKLWQGIVKFREKTSCLGFYNGKHYEKGKVKKVNLWFVEQRSIVPVVSAWWDIISLCSFLLKLFNILSCFITIWEHAVCVLQFLFLSFLFVDASSFCNFWVGNWKYHFMWNNLVISWTDRVSPVFYASLK